MKLGPSLIGAVVGAAVGVAAHLGVETVLNIEAGWFALVIGALTGFGARAMAGDAIKTANFLRAGLVAVIALAAIVGGTYAASTIVLNQNLAAYEEASAQPLPSLDEEPVLDERG